MDCTDTYSWLGRSMSIAILAVMVVIPYPISVLADWEEVVKTSSTSVVMIMTYDAHNQPLAIGSGFFISDSGQIATNYHVIESANHAVVKITGWDDIVPVDLVEYFDPAHDLAVLKVAFSATPLTFGNDSTLLIGARIMAIGNPEGLENTVSEGIVSGFRTIDSTFRLIQVTTPISPGSSGGPILNQEGKVVGLATASITSGQNLNFAIPITTLSALLSQPSINRSLSEVMTSRAVQDGLTVKGSNESDLVRIIGYDNSCSDCYFSIFNGLQRDITNIKLLVVCYEAEYDKRSQSNTKTSDIPLNYSTFSRSFTIASGLSRRTSCRLPCGYTKYYEITILDYEILDTRGNLDY